VVSFISMHFHDGIVRLSHGVFACVEQGKHVVSSRSTHFSEDFFPFAHEMKQVDANRGIEALVFERDETCVGDHEVLYSLFCCLVHHFLADVDSDDFESCFLERVGESSCSNANVEYERAVLELNAQCFDEFLHNFVWQASGFVVDFCDSIKRYAKLGNLQTEFAVS